MLESALADQDVVSCELTSNAGCVSTGTVSSNDITLTVSNNVIPSVSISASQTTLCSGTSVSFSAVTINGGTTPVLKWKKNGIDVGMNSTVYSDNALADQDVVSCELTSNAGCVSTGTVSSNDITLTVSNNVIPSVSISASQTTLCSGTPVSFSAVTVNGGTTPVLQWKKNGVDVGMNSTVYSDNVLAYHDVVSCELTSNAGCASTGTVSSNDITITVSNNVIPSVSISASQTTICSGTSVSFSALTTNGGTVPVVQWKKNGIDVGVNSSVYSDYTLANKDVISCELTSNASCLSGSVAASNNITVTVSVNVIPSVSISASQTSICAGTTVNFTAIPTDGGTTPIFQWKQNGVTAGTNSPVYSNSSLANNDVISCELTSNAVCASPGAVSSNPITVTVDSKVTPSITISASQTTLCSGTPVAFSVTTTNAGSSPNYQWKKNGVSIGADSPVYTDKTLQDNEMITCVLTSSAACVSGGTVTSNSIKATVKPGANAGTVSADKDSICDNNSANLSVTGSAGSIQWQSGSSQNSFTAISGATSLAFTTSPVTQTVYYRIVSSNGVCSDTSSAITVKAIASPVAAYKTDVKGLEVHFNSGTSAGATLYKWDFGDSTISDEANPVHIYKRVGDFKVCLDVANNSNCSSSICNDLRVDLATAISNIISDPSFDVYPNPFTNAVAVNCYNRAVEKIRVCDLLGREVNCEITADNQNTFHAKLPGNSVTGVYILSIKTTEGTYMYRVIKQ